MTADLVIVAVNYSNSKIKKHIEYVKGMAGGIFLDKTWQIYWRVEKR
jgi:hypothetical protein